MPQVRHGLFRFGAFVAARGPLPIDQCSDIAPRTSRTLTTLSLAPSSVFRTSRVAATLSP